MSIGSNTRYVFLYDATGPMTLRVYNGTAVTTYYYVRNLQGDIIAILNTAGKAVVEYTYDAWGNVLTVTGEAKDTIGQNNPLLYRGYVYDRETKLYYLQSRYYDPAMGRFINADEYASTGQGFVGYNMFAYCINNPVLLKDDAGVFALAATIATVTVSLVDLAIAIVAVAAVALVDKLVDNIVSGQSTLTSQSNTYSKGSGSTKNSNSQASAASGGAAAPLPPNDPNKNKPSGSQNNDVCFVAGTPILAAEGNKAIETIQPGDYVWAWDEATGETALKQVVETYVNETSELVHVFVNGEEIITTPSHPFYSPVKGWTAACKLRAGDMLVLVNGEYVVVEKVQHEILENPVIVYNFQVADYHTYYVSDAGVLVHNECINDHATKNTLNKSIQFDTEREARSFARTKIGHNPIRNGSGKLVSHDFRWQYRAKPNDILNRHIHLERINPNTGEVIINYHLRW